MTDIDVTDPFAGEIDEETRALATVAPQDFNPDDSAIVFSSINPVTRSEQILIYNIVSGNAAALADFVGQTLAITDVICHNARLIDQSTGQVSELIRTILIAEDGSAYSAVSGGVINCLKKLFKLIGNPPWNPPLLLVPQQARTSANRQVLLLRAVDVEGKKK